MTFNADFTAWLLKPENKEKYKGLTFEGFSKTHRELMDALLSDDGPTIPEAFREFLEKDTPEYRINKMKEQGLMTEIGGLYWTVDKLDQAQEDYKQQKESV